MNIEQSFRRLRKSVWFFPFLLFLLFTIFVSFKISGSSIGIYERILPSQGERSSVLYGRPQSIRSDEWLVWTQLTISQSENGFPRFNEDLGTGRDLALHFEIPSKDWSAVFKPHNWAFFILPLEYAFAFKWWFLAYILIIGAYLFATKLLGGKFLLSAIISVAFALSPFILWWYQTPVLGLIGIGFLIILAFIHIINGAQLKQINNVALSKSVSILWLAFLLIWFSFILYPPFQISIAIVVTFYCFGYLIQYFTKTKTTSKTILVKLAPVFIALLLTILAGVIFIYSHQDAISKMNGSVYPGDRNVVSGGQTPLTTLGGFLMPLVQSDFRSANYYSNQSEVSNFIISAPILLIPLIWISFMEYKKRRKIDWRLITMIICTTLILARMYIPFGDRLYRLLLLDKVPHGRLLIALGFLGFLMIVHFVEKSYELRLAKKQHTKFALLYTSTVFLMLLYVGFEVKKSYPLFLQHNYELLILVMIMSVFIFCLSIGKHLVAALAVLAISLFSSFRAMPLQSGLGPLYKSKIVDQINSKSNDRDSWLVIGSIYYEHIPLLANNDLLGGVQLYPDKDYWINLFGTNNEYNFNRKAHINFISSKDAGEISLPQGNLIVINIKDCSSKVLESADYVLSDHKLVLPCLTEIEIPEDTKTTLYMYKNTNSVN
ncbi:MAG TPA: hypothetical protein PKB09_00245 [Candidatus Saccharibacteria bacterium]|nr:hypothetical protein [Candidatus Saccharibacteria bacterium]